jgi:hypothetical protein
MGLIEFFQHNKTTIFVVILIIVLWFMVNSRCVSSMNDNLLSGFWKADVDFLDDSELSSFVLYFAPPNWSGNRACYILAEKDGELVINEPCSVKLSETWELGNLYSRLNTKSYSVSFSDLETNDFPKKQNMVFNPNSGKIVLSKADVIYGVFFKDSYLTDTIYNDEMIKPDELDELDEPDELDESDN